MGTYRALVVACDFYTKDFDPIPHTVEEAQEFGKTLATFGFERFEVQYSVDVATPSVIDIVGKFFTSVEPDDFVLFYFGGHGRRDDDGDLYLVLRDTWIRNIITTSLPAITLNRLINKCPARQKIIVLDACYGAAIERGSRSDSQQIDIKRYIQQGKGTAILTSSDAVQLSYGGREDRRSFTYFLTEGLRTGKADANKDGLISLDEWFDYGRDGVLSWQTKPYIQTPQIFHKPREDPIYIGRVEAEVGQVEVEADKSDDYPALDLPNSIPPPLNYRAELQMKGSVPYLCVAVINPNAFELTSVEIGGLAAPSSRVLFSTKSLFPGQKAEFETPFYTETGPLLQLIVRASDVHNRAYKPVVLRLDPHELNFQSPSLSHQEPGNAPHRQPNKADSNLLAIDPSSDGINDDGDESAFKDPSKNFH